MRDLDVTDVDQALAAVAVSRSSSTVAMAHLALTRAITRARAKNLVLRNVSALTGTPPGQQGRPSRSMTLAQATALTAAARAAGPRTGAYVMLSLCTGVRTEEARALRWEHVDFGDPASVPPRPAGVAVWRSVPARGDTKTRTSRRTLALPQLAVTALQALHDDTLPGPEDLVFCTATGRPLGAGNVRRSFRAVCRAAGLGPDWTPRELRHTFVSLMSDSDVAVEEIARLVGHANSKAPGASSMPPVPWHACATKGCVIAGAQTAASYAGNAQFATYPGLGVRDNRGLAAWHCPNRHSLGIMHLSARIAPNGTGCPLSARLSATTRAASLSFAHPFRGS